MKSSQENIDVEKIPNYYFNNIIYFQANILTRGFMRIWIWIFCFPRFTIRGDRNNK